MDSRATTGRPSDRASETSGAILIDPPIIPLLPATYETIKSNPSSLPVINHVAEQGDKNELSNYKYLIIKRWKIMRESQKSVEESIHCVIDIPCRWCQTNPSVAGDWLAEKEPKTPLKAA